MKLITTFALTAILAATAALAHQGVKNRDVMARMEVMMEIQAGTKVLGQMLKGARPFEREEAGAAAEAIREGAQEVVDAFTPQADDPKSEASPLIWQDFDAFEAEAQALVTAAAALDTTSEAALKQSFAKMATTCRSCHATYQE